MDVGDAFFHTRKAHLPIHTHSLVSFKETTKKTFFLCGIHKKCVTLCTFSRTHLYVRVEEY